MQFWVPSFGLRGEDIRVQGSKFNVQVQGRFHLLDHVVETVKTVFDIFLLFYPQLKLWAIPLTSVPAYAGMSSEF